MNVSDIDDLLDEVDATAEEIAARHYAEAMASVTDLLEHSFAFGVGVSVYCPNYLRRKGINPVDGNDFRHVAEEFASDRQSSTFRVGDMVLRNVHLPERCEGRPCVLHRPTAHHMSTWPLIWRDDRGIFERLCAHGVGHPDPDQFDFWREIGAGSSHQIHGCDRCCCPPDDDLDILAPTG